jgi:hypothetical protein
MAIGDNGKIRMNNFILRMKVSVPAGEQAKE